MRHERLGILGILAFAISCGSPSASTPKGTGSEPDSAVKTAQSGSSSSAPVDLRLVTGIACKGRVQDRDYNSIPVVDQLIAQGPSCIRFLINHLDDETRMNPGAIDCWNSTTVADIALIILTDLFRDSSWGKYTLPEADWRSILEYSKDSRKSSEQGLWEFVHKHGRGAIKAKWTKIWNENRDRIYWDEAERCFNIRK